MRDLQTLPMFPLGSVVFPYTAIPLKIFEPRYHELIDRAVQDDSQFGTVLIERGLEVGGGDQRFDIGTRLRVIGESTAEAGRLVMVAGTGRIRVEQWLEDDPHPWAEVSVLDETEPVAPAETVQHAATRLRTLMAVVSEMGEDTAGLDLDIADDVVVASFQLCALTPVTPIDSYRLIQIDDSAGRVDAVISMLDDRIELLRSTMGG